MDVLSEADLIARRRWAEHQLDGWLGVPSPKAHRQADRWLAVVQDVEDAFRPDVVLRWR